MSVNIQSLTKIYGTQVAVNGISFEAQKGEIVGFLGPNGAGKTTTMKILTCYIPPTEGKAEVCGYDVLKNPLEVRKKIGYLPEHNPLYKEMYVREYLQFIAGVHHIAKPMQRVAQMIEQVGLGREAHKTIGQLSKGYRQRVGLAQAMIHDPEVLILDEPTSGLDPNQLIEIRQLIAELGKEKTVIFSSHIMQEVQALCNRVLIINKGNLVADDRIENLANRIAGANVVTVQFLEPVPAEYWQKLPALQKVEDLGEDRWQLYSPISVDIRADLFRFAVDNKLTIIELQKEKYSVEDVFQQLTV